MDIIDAAPGAENVNVIYTFKYNSDIHFGYKIALSLPDWSGTPTIDSVCTGIGASVSTNGVGENYTATLEIIQCTSASGFTYTTETACENAGTWTAGACSVNEGGREASREACEDSTSNVWNSGASALSANTECEVHFSGLTNPLEFVQENSASIRHNFKVSNGNTLQEQQVQLFNGIAAIFTTILLLLVKKLCQNDRLLHMHLHTIKICVLVRLLN